MGLCVPTLMILPPTMPKISAHLRHYSRFPENRAGDRARPHCVTGKPVKTVTSVRIRQLPSNSRTKSLIGFGINQTNFQYPQIRPRSVSKQGWVCNYPAHKRRNVDGHFGRVTWGNPWRRKSSDLHTRASFSFEILKVTPSVPAGSIAAAVNTAVEIANDKPSNFELAATLRSSFAPSIAGPSAITIGPSGELISPTTALPVCRLMATSTLAV
jgi:hypothetical protein